MSAFKEDTYKLQMHSFTRSEISNTARSINTVLNCYNDTMITHIDEYITGIIIRISIPQAAGPNLDASSMLFTKHDLHHILVPLET